MLCGMLGSGCLEGWSSKTGLGFVSCTCSLSGVKCTICRSVGKRVGRFPRTSASLLRVRLGFQTVWIFAAFWG